MERIKAREIGGEFNLVFETLPAYLAQPLSRWSIDRWLVTEERLPSLPYCSHLALSFSLFVSLLAHALTLVFLSTTYHTRYIYIAACLSRPPFCSWSASRVLGHSLVYYKANGDGTYILYNTIVVVFLPSNTRFPIELDPERGRWEKEGEWHAGSRSWGNAEMTEIFWSMIIISLLLLMASDAGGRWAHSLLD